jgi:hypothetical protein
MKATHYQGNKHKQDSDISNRLGSNNTMDQIIQKHDTKLTIIVRYTYLQSLPIIFCDVCIFIQTVHFR